ncbi:MAG: helix-turn-helix domain-containing protein [Opitutales bacterium]|nr:helix-turn-helix domain-containing protein [Opitutales bacterium]
MSIGQQLKEAREKLGFDERSASDRTHIRRHYIIAMENDDFDSIDLAPVYRVGFLRIYAKLLKLNADALVSEFRETQNAKASGTRSPFRLPPMRPTSAETADGEDAFSTTFPPPSTARVPRKFAILGVVIAVAAIALVSVLTLKSCSSDGASANDAAALADGEDANTPAYEIEITTNNSQKVTIYEQYKDWDKNNGKPIAGAVILDEFIPAGRAKKITGRGKLYIREEVLKGSKIKYPSKESFDNAGNAALIPLGAKPRQMSGTTSTAWLIDPDL